jgi:hypothetical protein
MNTPRRFLNSSRAAVLACVATACAVQPPPARPRPAEEAVVLVPVRCPEPPSRRSQPFGGPSAAPPSTATRLAPPRPPDRPARHSKPSDVLEPWGNH